MVNIRCTTDINFNTQNIQPAGQVVGLYFCLHFFLQFFILLLRLDQPLQLRYNFINHTLRARARASCPYHSIQDQIQRGTGPLLACLPWLAFIITITTSTTTPKTSCTRSVSVSPPYLPIILGALHKTVATLQYFPHPSHIFRFHSILRGLFVVSGCQSAVMCYVLLICAGRTKRLVVYGWGEGEGIM